MATAEDLILVQNFQGQLEGGGENVIFGADDSSVHINGRNINILVLGEGPTQGLDNSTITAKAKYPLNFTESGKRFVFKSAL